MDTGRRTGESEAKDRGGGWGRSNSCGIRNLAWLTKGIYGIFFIIYSNQENGKQGEGTKTRQRAQKRWGKERG